MVADFVKRIWPKTSFNQEKFILEKAFLDHPELMYKHETVPWSGTKEIDELFSTNLKSILVLGCGIESESIPGSTGGGLKVNLFLSFSFSLSLFLSFFLLSFSLSLFSFSLSFCFFLPFVIFFRVKKLQSLIQKSMNKEKY